MRSPLLFRVKKRFFQLNILRSPFLERKPEWMTLTVCASEGAAEASHMDLCCSRSSDILTERFGETRAGGWGGGGGGGGRGGGGGV